MARRGRPASGTKPMVFHIQLRLAPGQDDAVIVYLQSAPPRLRAQYVLRAMQAGALVPPPASGAEEDLQFDDLWQ